MQLNLRQIEVFRAVMITGSISGAAKLLFVSQPAVSRTLAHTEQRFSFALFERIKGRLYPTPEARQLFREVEHVYSGLRRVGEVANELSERRSGILHIVSSPSIGHMLIPLAIARFRQVHPDVKITFFQMPYETLTQALLENRAEIGVTIASYPHPSLVHQPLAQAELVCICPRDHPLARMERLTIEDLLPYPLISYNIDTPIGALVEQMYTDADQVRRVAVEVGSPQNACSLVQSGAGIAIVDAFTVKSRMAGDFVVRPIKDAKRLTANLVQPRLQPLSQLAQAFTGALRECMRIEGFSLSPISAKATAPK